MKNRFFSSSLMPRDLSSAIRPARLHNSSRQAEYQPKYDPARGNAPVRKIRQRKRDAHADPNGDGQACFRTRFRIWFFAHAVILASDGPSPRTGSAIRTQLIDRVLNRLESLVAGGH